LQRLARNKLLNIFASNSLVESVLTLMGGGGLETMRVLALSKPVIQ